MVMPTTSYPSLCSISAATVLSIPPLMAIKTLPFLLISKLFDAKIQIDYENDFSKWIANVALIPQFEQSKYPMQYFSAEYSYVKGSFLFF
jgi:hypothetical protein